MIFGEGDFPVVFVAMPLAMALTYYLFQWWDRRGDR